jgi:Ala-tRNA(Pro) deacylase
MAMARRVRQYLQAHDIDYSVVAHNHTATSMETARAAHVPGNRIAKTVVLEDDNGYVMAVLPATYKIDLGELHRQTNRRLGLATERELSPIFDDCELGAIPPLGQAYGLATIVDGALAEQTDIYFDAGDHEQLVHVSAEGFSGMIGDARLMRFSRHV